MEELKSFEWIFLGLLILLMMLWLSSPGDRRQRMEVPMLAGGSGERAPLVVDGVGVGGGGHEDEQRVGGLGRQEPRWEEHVHQPSWLSSRYSEREAKKVQEVLNVYRGICVNGREEAELGYGLELLKQSFKENLEEVISIASKSCSAEKLALDAMQQVKQAEAAYHDELQKRREMENKLKKAEEAYFNEMQKGKEREEILPRERHKLKQAEAAYNDELQKRKKMERMLAWESRKLKEVEEELKHAKDQQAALDQREAADFSQISYSDIEEATQGLHESFKIGGGGYGNVYRGLLRCTPVAIKVLNPTSRQGEPEFEREMEILTQVRHPNMVCLIGTCPKAKALIYEYLPNGSLEDRLLRKKKSPPLSWPIRIRILGQVRAALIFLHSAGPHGIVHGDLKPDNILLDANLVAKLGDFGISRLMRREAGGTSPSATTICWETEQPKGTFPYIDPVYVQTGVLRPKSDVFSFGVVILRVITGLPAKEIAKLMNDGVQGGQLCHIRDKTAGKWPPLLAAELAKLALACCKMDPKERPDLKSEDWKVLASMMAAAPSRMGVS